MSRIGQKSHSEGSHGQERVSTAGGTWRIKEHFRKLCERQEEKEGEKWWADNPTEERVSGEAIWLGKGKQTASPQSAVQQPCTYQPIFY